ncbi:MAG TPA: hypothetical protein VFI38_03100 [Candidatus Acidoferrum sp.]|nr:hypothetical protein [Candidatus Acidoferrum sp.]
MRRFARLTSALSTFLSLCVVGFIPLLLPTPPQDDARNNWFIDPAGKTGAISRFTTEADLVKLYGAKNVKQGDMDLGEGFTEPATFLFQDDPLSKIAISWKDKEKKAYPARVQIDGQRSGWNTYGRVTLGTSLKELEKLNGGAFELFGFEWDYSGTVASWEKGKLEEFFHQKGNVVLRLSPSENTAVQAPEYESVLGDGTFPSTNPAMQKLNPRVYQIIWIFE